MRIQIAISLGFALAFGLLNQGARAASYQQIDGTIVDPIPCWSECDTPYLGPNLGPNVVAPFAQLQGRNLENADLAGATLNIASLRFARVTNAIFVNANLSQSSLREANLSGSDLSVSTLTFADLQYAEMPNVNLFGADLRRANLDGVDLWGAILTGANLTEASYNNHTTFPIGFNPVAAGMVVGTWLINNGQAPPNPENVIDGPERSFIVNDSGCNALVKHPCVAPGTPTTVTGSVGTISLYEHSSFTGDVTWGASTHDQSFADVRLRWDGSSVSARDQSVLVAEGHNLSGMSANASRSAQITIGGLYWWLALRK